MLDTRYRHARSLPELRELDQVFIEDAGDPQEKEQRRMWLEKEKERVVQGLGAEHREVFGGPPQWGAAHRGCAAQGGQGFMRWYLGVGERTFDWVVAKVKKSRRFQWQDPTTSYRDLRAAAESTENT
ncbi:hypothetical protein LPJ73_000640 [Coemansia sp. RSA 2703]|nr:hypothetical protein LPJ73_000640 [Coemansia sp. RSA 2703]KAJ2377787.1 hypothetical protein IW150_001177 [Coemansia sp. RSA 2607]KAJ2398178.1 hypothetical protein GGI05_000234 [Coemansia sp. RSA 2603]